MNISFLSPAKINLHLSVFEKQTDGYHRVETSMLKISLCDQIHMQVEDGEGIAVEVQQPFEAISGPSNLAYRAAVLFLESTKLQKKISIQIEKKVPMGGGLGGGSANAGTVLLALNKSFGEPLSRQQLMDLGKKLGADVAFFAQEHDFGFLKGRGDELVESFEFPKLPIVIVFPNIHASTPEVYKRLGRSLTWDKSGGIEAACNRKITGWKDVDFLLQKGNDLQSVTEAMHPEIGRIRNLLKEKGAYFSQMSGSGASIFGLFDSEVEAKYATSSLEKNGQCFLVHSGTTLFDV